MKALPEEGAPGAQAAALHLPASKWGVAGTRALPDLQAKERATAVQICQLDTVTGFNFLNTPFYLFFLPFLDAGFG